LGRRYSSRPPYAAVTLPTLLGELNHDACGHP
jgi:hypothetical protein